MLTFFIFVYTAVILILFVQPSFIVNFRKDIFYEWVGEAQHAAIKRRCASHRKGASPPFLNPHWNKPVHPIWSSFSSTNEAVPQCFLQLIGPLDMIRLDKMWLLNRLREVFSSE